MGQHTPLYQKHLDAGAKMVDFAGWDMPLNYGSQIEEHKRVRSTAGVFDVSHMTVVDISGDDAKAYLRKLLATDVEKLDAELTVLANAQFETPEFVHMFSLPLTMERARFFSLQHVLEREMGTAGFIEHLKTLRRRAP